MLVKLTSYSTSLQVLVPSVFCFDNDVCFFFFLQGQEEESSLPQLSLPARRCRFSRKRKPGEHAVWILHPYCVPIWNDQQHVRTPCAYMLVTRWHTCCPCFDSKCWAWKGSSWFSNYIPRDLYQKGFYGAIATWTKKKTSHLVIGNYSCRTSFFRIVTRKAY